MNGFHRGITYGLTFALAAAMFAAAPASAPAAVRGDCASAANLMHVHRRLDGAIDQLSHDQHDYDGHRVAAMNDLQSARNELIAAEQYAENDDHDNARCFVAHGSTGGSDRNWGTRNQNGSRRNIAQVSAWVERLIDQLNLDERDYGGHRVAAINDMQQARRQLAIAEQTK